jgi:hypothetical protein
MLLAALEVWHSRPFTPTRRVALGHIVLPVEPPPGFGGILLGAVVAAHLPSVDPDLVPELDRLIAEVARGQRIVQPRLRHRYQVDRHGLARSEHRLVGRGEDLGFELRSTGSPLAQVLGAVYATERLAPPARHAVAGVLHKAVVWRGPIGPSLISFLAGVSGPRARSLAAFVDPQGWALDVLGFAAGTAPPSRRDVRARFRVRLREVHPDHGGDEEHASQSIGDLAEARRILLS